MLGGVILTQGKNVLRRRRLMVDMTTGVSRGNPIPAACRAVQSSGQGAGAARRFAVAGPGRPASSNNKTEIISKAANCRRGRG